MHIPEGLVDQFGGKFCRGLQPSSHVANIFAFGVVSSLWCVLKQGFAFLLKLYLFSFVSCFARKCCETAKIGCTQHQLSFVIITVIICVITIIVIIMIAITIFTETTKTILSTNLLNHALHRMFVSNALFIFFCRWVLIDGMFLSKVQGDRSTNFLSFPASHKKLKR